MSLQFVHAHDSPHSHDDAIWGTQWTAADQALSIGADGKIILWDPSNGSPLRTLPPHPLALVSLSTDQHGKQALFNSIEGTVTLWDLTTGDVLGQQETFSREQGGPEPAWSVSLNPQGGTFAASNASGNVHILSADPSSFGSLIQTYTSGRPGFGMFVSHSPDARRIALSTQNGAIFIFDIESGSLAASYSSHAMCVRSLAWSSDSQLLLSASDDKRLVLHDVRVSSGGGKPGSGAVASLNGHSSWVLSTSLSPDSGTAASGSSDRTIKIWDIGQRACVSTIQENQEVWGVAWRPSSGSSFISGGSGCVRFWRAAGTA